MTAAHQQDDDRTGQPQGALRSRPPLRPAPCPDVWWARLAHRGPGPVEHSLVAVNSDRFPDGTPVDLTAVDPRGRRPAGWLVDLRYRAADATVVTAEVSERLADPGLPLWFAEVAHATSDIPAASIHAFAAGPVPAGTYVTPREVATAGVRMADRIGEIRWWTRSGLLDVVTVEDDARGRGVDRALGCLADTLALLRGWAPLVAPDPETGLPVADRGRPWSVPTTAQWRPRLRRAG